MGRAEIRRHPRRYGKALRRVCLFVAAAFPIVLAAQPACAPDPAPAYPAIDAPPAVRVLHDAHWTPPPCASWTPATSATLITTAARFRAADIAALRSRVAAISKLSGLVYWSTTAQRWQPMILSARTLTGRDPAPADLIPGAAFDLQQEDNLFGMANFRLRILVSTADRLVIATENTTALRLLGMPVFAAGEVQTITFLDQESKGIWRYYAVARTSKAAALLPGSDASLINRAVAMFRYLAAIPADREPPAAR
jgi:hypothetical protein